MKNKEKGFSLVELIVTIAIMSVLVGVLAPSMLRYVEKARVAVDVRAIGELEEQIKHAAAHSDCYMEIGSSGITFTCARDSRSLDVIGDGTSKFRNECARVVGDTLTFKSNSFLSRDISMSVSQSTDGGITITSSGIPSFN